jgi:hypothetical protein
MNYHQHSDLTEGLEKNDLSRLVHPELHIDEFKSKLGDDADVVVLSFKLASKEPADDLVAFVEKGYTWVLDADKSSGEMDDGSYVVFVELDRNDKSAENIMDLLKELALKGKLIFVVIHQPSSEIFKMFDKLKIGFDLETIRFEKQM